MSDNQKAMIDTIKAALDNGLTVTMAKNPNYTVIKDSTGQYLIAFQHGTPSANYIGLHGREGTKYEHLINMVAEWIIGDTDNDYECK